MAKYKTLYTNWYIRAITPAFCGFVVCPAVTGRRYIVKIYIRERQKVGEGVESPKYRIVAVTGGEIQIAATHFRKFEIEQIAKDVGAEIVYMKPVADDHKKKK
jgi:hypothetical protein